MIKGDIPRVVCRVSFNLPTPNLELSQVLLIPHLELVEKLADHGADADEAEHVWEELVCDGGCFSRRQQSSATDFSVDTRSVGLQSLVLPAQNRRRKRTPKTWSGEPLDCVLPRGGALDGTHSVCKQELGFLLPTGEGTLAPSCSLRASAPLIPSFQRALLSHSIFPPSFRFSHVLHSFATLSFPLTPPSRRQDNRQRFEPAPCGNGAQPFGSRCVHVMPLE